MVCVASRVTLVLKVTLVCLGNQENQVYQDVTDPKVPTGEYVIASQALRERREEQVETEAQALREKGDCPEDQVNLVYPGMTALQVYKVFQDNLVWPDCQEHQELKEQRAVLP